MSGVKARLRKQAVWGSKLLNLEANQGDFMQHSRTSLLIVVLTLFFFTSCSYEFSEPPFQRSELIEITETQLGKELLSKKGSIPDTDETRDLIEGLTEDTQVYEISDNFLIQQKEKDEGSGWELTVLTKNNHHFIYCSLMQDEDLAIEPKNNVDVKEKEDGTIYLVGEKEGLKQLALEVSLAAPKLCMAVPYADASAVIDPTTEYKNQIDRLTTELDITTTTTTEYKNQIDRLTTELDVATTTMLLGQEKAQDLQKLNQQLDEELSSLKTRSLLLLVIGSIAGLVIIIIVVRSRLKGGSQ